MKSEKTLPFLYFFIVFFLFASSAQALRVKKIQPEDGILVLDDSRQVRLAGLHLAPEAFKSLAILFSNQDIELDEEKALIENSGTPFVYMSVKTLEISFPFKANTPPKGSKLLLNEVLISSGLAAVDERKPFKNKIPYLKLQDEARRQGHGMWSEESAVKKKS